MLVCGILGVSPLSYADDGAQEQPSALSDDTPVRKKSRRAKLRYRVDLSAFEAVGLEKRFGDLSTLVARRKEGVPSRAALEKRAVEDRKAALKLLRAEGYYDSLLTTAIETRDERITVSFSLEAGPRYMIDAVSVSYLEDEPRIEARQAIENALALPLNTPGQAEEVLAAQGRILASLPNLGYPYAELAAPDIIVNHETNTMRVTYRVNTGPLTRYGEIRIQGLETVKRDYIERFISWSPGDIYDQREVDTLRRRISQTALFNTTAIVPEPLSEETDKQATGDGKEAAGVAIMLSERKHRTVEASGSFSTAEGVGVRGGWTHRNFFGRGERLVLSAIGSEREQSLRADLTKPHFRRLDQSLLIGVGLIREDTEGFTSLGGNARVGLDRRLSPEWSLSTAVMAEYAQVTDASGEEEFILLSLPTVLRWDGSDSFFNPTRGGRVALSAQPEGAWEDGDVFGFLTSELNASVYQSVGGNGGTVLAGRARLGTIAFADFDQVPANRRFFSGGGGSIRGFGFQEVGPEDINGNALGGLSVAEFAVEARVRITETIGVVPFFEGGNVYVETLPDFSGFRYGAGLGVRYYTSFAPIRLDLATPINPDPGDSPIQVYISIGQAF
ncbi:MAG: autotransporter assembly complex family protein [Pseudomonadota bacterium]